MAVNNFNKIRKSYAVKVLFTSILSNLVLFGQPIQQIISNHYINDAKRSSIINYSSSSGTEEVSNSERSNKGGSDTLKVPATPKKTTLAQPNATFKSYNVFYAQQPQGVIGKLSSSEGENPRDNFFTINLPDNIHSNNYKATLVYDVYGVASAAHTTKSINSNPSYGGKVILKSQQWNAVSEDVSLTQLKSGINEIFFNRRVEENYQYEIKNLRIKLENGDNNTISTKQQQLINFNGNVYLLGSVIATDIKHVEAFGQTIPVQNGVFEHVLQNVPETTTKIDVIYNGNNESKRIVSYPLTYQNSDSDYQFSDSKLSTNEIGYNLTDCAIYDALTITVEEEAIVSSPKRSVSVKGLQFKDVKTLSNDMKNVTAGKFLGYKVKKYNVTDSTAIQLRLKYDFDKIPDGYTPKDVKTFYFDKKQRNWKMLPVDSLDYGNEEIVTTIAGGEGETDYINGVIQVPQSPEVGSFAPTTITDMKYADPSAGIVGIQPPSPNSTGVATTSFPIKLPPGRNGLQPSLQVTYNSEGGNGWMGLGWNLATQAITLNTKWGAPLFDGDNETELYSLSGSDLVLNAAGTEQTPNYTNPHRETNAIARVDDRQFYTRKEGGYQEIIRHGTNPTDYWWEVTDKQGNKSFYGGTPDDNAADNSIVLRTPDINGVANSGNIGYWPLKRIQDPFGNYIEYNYDKTNSNVSIGESSIEAQELYISSITYTMHANIPNYYKIDFIRNEYSLPLGNPSTFTPRNDVTFNARNGYFQVFDDLLTEIHVSFHQQGQPNTRIRSYKFDYEEKSFLKQQLIKISEFDAGNELFYSNTLEYYDDDFNPDSDVIISTSTPDSWENIASNDGVSGKLDDIQGGLNIVPNGSPLGTSTASGFSFGLRGGVGIGFVPINIGGTLGVSYNSSKNNQKTKISFLDVNGDGLPDKVYQAPSGLFYRPNILNEEGTKYSFGDFVPISGVNKLSTTTSRTSGFGIDGGVGFAGFGVSAGKSWSTTRSRTDNYFTDFNGDGLPDMVASGRVNFNTTITGSVNNTLTRHFDQNVNNSENPIVSGIINAELLNDLELESLDELRAEYPQFDHVKVWSAPYTGKVSVSADEFIELKNINYYTNHPLDGSNQIKLSIEHFKSGSANSDAEIIESLTHNLPNNSTQVSSVGLGSHPIDVEKGDLIFFRAHNVGYGYGAEVKWNPRVDYQGFDTAGNQFQFNIDDETGKFGNEYRSTNDYINNNAGLLELDNNNTYQINFNLDTNPYTQDQFSDAISFVIKKTKISLQDGSEVVENIWRKTYNPVTGGITSSSNASTDQVSIPSNSNTNYYYILQFYVESDSNVNWESINWEPYYIVNNVTDDPLNAPVKYKIYNDNINESIYWILGGELPDPNIQSAADEDDPFLRISHNFTLPSNEALGYIDDALYPLKVNWVVKQKVGTQSLNAVNVVVKKTFYILNTQSQGYVLSKTTSTVGEIDPLLDEYYFEHTFSKEDINQIKSGNAGKIYAAFYIDNPNLINNNADINFVLSPDVPNLNDYSFSEVTLQSPFIAKTEDFYGIPYRGWGQFLYNGGLDVSFIEEGENAGELQIGPASVAYGINPIDVSALYEGDVEPTDPNDENSTNTFSLRYVNYTQANSGARMYSNDAIPSAEHGINNNILVTKLGRFAENDIFDIYIDPDTVLQLQNTPNQNSVFIGLTQRSKSKGSAESGGVGFTNGTKSEANSQVLNQYIDINGDRYPDIVSRSKIQYTNMLGALTDFTVSNADDPNTDLGTPFVSGDQSDDETIGINVPAMFPNSSESSNAQSTGNKTKTNVNSGINTSSGESYNSKQWIDINGDGLVDKVLIKENEIKVRLNRGYSFTNEVIWYTASGNSLVANKRENSSLGGGVSLGNSFAAGLGVAISEAHTGAGFVDVNGDGLPDLVINSSSSSNYYLNTGRGFEGTPKTFYNDGDGRIQKNESVSGNIYGSFTKGFIIPLVFLPPIKITASISAGTNASHNETIAAVQDINGDGYTDVLKKGSNINNSNISVHLNKLAKTHLLKKVNLPLGGSWTIDYKRDGNTYDMPNNKWVLTTIRTNDGFTGDNNLKPDETLTSATYENPKYDRREREFFGYEKLIIEEKYPDTEETYRKAEKSYHNNNYYLSGAEKSSILYNASDEILSKQETLYNILDPDNPIVNLNATEEDNFLQTGLATTLFDKSRLFIAPVRVTATSYENGEGLTAVKEFKEYDKYGNLLTYVDYGEGNNDVYRTEIVYYDEGAIANLDNATGFPTRVRVFNNATNELLRQRTVYRVSTKGKVNRLITKLNENQINVTKFVYDDYGNLIVVLQTDNTNDLGEIYNTGIYYDTVLSTYPITYGNSFEENSYTTYNYLFGIPVFTTDSNGQSMRTRIDNRGRVVEVTGPNELALENQNGNGNAWTIRMNYKGQMDAMSTTLASDEYMIPATGSFEYDDITQEGTAQHYAVTRHFDPEFANGTTTTTNELLTISIADGFGQPLQVKKTHQTGTTTKWIINGFEKKDAFGRTTENYLPITQTPYPTDVYNIDNASLQYVQLPAQETPITVTTYDARNRVKTVQQIDETANAVIEYSIEDNMFVQKLTNENGQTNKTYTDIRGRQRKTIQNEGVTGGNGNPVTPNTTTFGYNAINELLTVTNTQGQTTRYTYDLAGRKTEVKHPDRGVVTFTYDTANRMTVQTNSNLLLDDAGESIEYTYDFGRLIGITYPQNPENNVTYTYGAYDDPLALSENAVGRLLQQEDASGVQVFGYGRMGELTKNLRSVAVAGYQSYWFFTQWQYDSWNRVQKIIYPDEEEVDYEYNTAGALKKITSIIPNRTVQDIVENIKYNDYGERHSIKYGNGATTTYNYDSRRRMNQINHNFSANFAITKDYAYDPLSNITSVTTGNPTSSLPDAGEIGGPINHTYQYDAYNRLTHAEGNYVGANDIDGDYLRQEYSLDMEYNVNHTIRKKRQVQYQGAVSNHTDVLTGGTPVYKNSYELDYNYDATQGSNRNITTNNTDYTYGQPHAVRKLTETPSWVTNPAADDPRIKHKEITYDANGNQTEIAEILGDEKTVLRRNVWDEENRLLAVDLKPDEKTVHPVAVYTYDAGGERTIKYNYDRIDTHSNATEAGESSVDNIMIYPSGLLVGKAIYNTEKGANRLSYTKHYYVGAERVSTKTGTAIGMGYFPEGALDNQMVNLNQETIASTSDVYVDQARTAIVAIHNELNVAPPVLLPDMDEDGYTGADHQESHGLELHTHYFHPDHLGSSSYITNGAAEVTQHMEYLPFGETLVDEHNNSHNTPFKFNGKEFDEETGNYYYSARYYDPKLSIFISVDPLVEQTGDTYGYCYQNPINLTDPTGMSADLPPTDYYNLYGKHVKHVDDGSDAKKMVLTFSKKSKEVDETIAKGYYVNQFTDSEVEKMDEIYSYGKKDETELEKGFLRGQNGTSSEIVTGVEKREIGSEEWQHAIDDLSSKGDTPASSVHLHNLIFDKNKKVKQFGAPRGSDGDILEKNILGIQPSIALGWKRIEIVDFNSVSTEKNYKYLPKVGFFTLGVREIISVDYSTLKNAIKKMNKHKP
ncbi:toxin TcdB middle/N-terminal domain-containing protein [Flavobacterium litorale]|uniref:Insecticide toxin TcdB middle/N-terminal domain-containing protein n=1 Tax=Flavobacterium litorale TaxID=2856519 RepID=A0ABX8VBP1_9FLAO|nr:toxin TcdB middle/N-terminal domain-containing protein [Flavobacterium litorale]QYJ68245.1 hypothetical protein K1I41_12065 [Flavobacterium litorale]